MEAVPDAAVQTVNKLKGSVYLAGVCGPLVTRIAKQLINNNTQVTIGVPEDDRASEALEFALKFELLTKEEAKRVKLRTIDDFGDPDNFGIPSGATMVVVAGEQQGKLKVDDQVVAAVVDAAVERGAARIVLVTPLGGGGGGLLGGLFGGGGSAGAGAASRGSGQLRLNRSEQKVSSSGIPFSIVRVGAPSDGLPAAGDVQVAPAGSLSRGPLSRSQAASVVAQVLLQASPSANVVMEAAVTDASAHSSIATSVANTLGEAEIASDDPEEAVEEAAPVFTRRVRGFLGRTKQQASEVKSEIEAEAGEAARGGRENSGGFDLQSLFGGRGAQQAVSDVEDEAEEAARKVSRPARNFLNKRPQLKQQAAQVEEEVEEASEKASKPLFNFLGGGGRGQQLKSQAEEVEEEVEEAARKAGGPLKNLFSGRPKQSQQQVENGAEQAGRQVQRGGRAARQAAAKAERATATASRGTRQLARRGASQVEEELEDAPRKKGVFWSMLGADKSGPEDDGDEEEATPQRGLFSFGGTRKVKKSTKEAERAVKAAPRPAKRVAMQAKSKARDLAEEVEPKKKGGLLSALGFGGQTSYADDE